MKTTTLWAMLRLLLLLGAGPVAAQCPAMTNVQVYNITPTSAAMGSNYSGPASSYTVTVAPTAGGPSQTTVLGPSNSVSNLTPSTAYTGQIVVNCSNGQASPPATFTFTTAPLPPANDDCAQAVSLPVTATCAAPLAGTITSATPSLPLGDTDCIGINDPNDVWYRFVASGATQVLHLTAQFNGALQVRDGASCAATTLVQCERFDVGSSGSVAFNKQLSGLVAGHAYYLRIYGQGRIITPAPFTLCLTPGPPAPANDECSAAQFLIVNPSCFSTTGTVAGASAGTRPDGSQPGRRDVWYRFVATNPLQYIQLDAVDHTRYFVATVWQGNCGQGYSITGCYNSVDQLGSSYQSGTATIYNCIPGEVYYVCVYAGLGADPGPQVETAAQFSLCITGLRVCPTPTALPTTTTSSTAQLNWTSTGTRYTTLEYGPAGFVRGTGTSVQINAAATYALTGLLPGTTYCYYAQESCGGTIYGGTSGLGGPFCFTTNAPPTGCDQPTSLQASAISASSAVLQWTAAPLAGTGFEVEYGLQGFTPGTGTLIRGATSGIQLSSLYPSTDYCFYVRRDCGTFAGPACFRTLGPATPPDLVVSTAQTLAGGSYRNVTITGTGTLSLTADLVVAGTLTVQSGGTLRTTYPDRFTQFPTCATIAGPGTFDLQDGATLKICAPLGLTAAGTTGAVQVTGARSFSSGASYVYEGQYGQTQRTGPGLPATVRNLSVGTATTYGNLVLSQPLAVREVLATPGGGLVTNGQALTLLSDANGTALFNDSNNGTVQGNVTVQRYINSPYQGVGYRHYSPPIQNATVGSLATTGFAPVVNGAYNTAANPGLTTPYPTVYAYDEARLATSPATNLTDFDKGWTSPTSLTDVLQVGRGYTVHLPGTALLSVTGQLTGGSAGGSALTRGAGAEAGWALVGNPFPAPLDASTFTLGTGLTDNFHGVGAAIYVFESTGPYVGQYRTAVAGVGGSPVIASGQGFFVRVLPNQTSTYVQFNRANRKTTFDAADNTFRRAAAETRPLLTLALRDAAGHADPASLYFTATATPGFDPAADARKLPNSTGLNLASLAGTEDYAISALPLLGAAALVVPLQVGVPAAGTYELAVEQLLNFAPGTTLWLRDALLGTLTPLTATTRYACTLAGTTAPGRFSIEFRPAGALATAAQTLATQVQLFPNPARAGAPAGVTISLPARPGTAATATLLNALGQVVSTIALTTQANQASGRLPIPQLAAGVYVVRVQAGTEVVTKRLVVE